MRTLFVAALAATLAGCSSQPPPHAQAAIESGAHTNRFVCPNGQLGRRSSWRPSGSNRRPPAPGPQVGTRRKSRRLLTPGTGRISQVRRRSRLRSRRKPSRRPLASHSHRVRRKHNRRARATRVNPGRRVQAMRSRSALSALPSDTKTIEAQVAAATALAKRITAATAPPSPDTKTDNKDGSGRLEKPMHGNIEKPGSASANGKDLLVAVLMAHPDLKSVSELTDKTIAIDDLYSASNGTIRTALFAAGAFFVQLSEGSRDGDQSAAQWRGAGRNSGPGIGRSGEGVSRNPGLPDISHPPFASCPEGTTIGDARQLANVRADGASAKSRAFAVPIESERGSIFLF